MTAPILVDGVPVDYSSLPRNLRDEMKLYIEQGTRCGEFLHNVLCDQLTTAVLHCYANPLSDLPEISRWLIWHAPVKCHGSTKRVRAWLDKFREEEEAKANDQPAATQELDTAESQDTVPESHRPDPAPAAAQVQDALDLAIIFHHTYERLAPSIGYDTRKETRVFDPESPNGKLMVAVCAEILPKIYAAPQPHGEMSEIGRVGKHQPNTAPVWARTKDGLPPDETPVLIVRRGHIQIAEIRWEKPGYEDTFEAFRYWDDPNNDGQDWDEEEITYWMSLPDLPTTT